MGFLGQRVLTQFLAGHHPGPDAAIGKLQWSEYHKVVTELAMDILGADALHWDGRKPPSSFGSDDSGALNDPSSWIGTFLNARAGTIYAGSVADSAQHHWRDDPRSAEGASPAGTREIALVR